MSRARVELRARSPVHGLDRRNLAPVEVLAQSVSCAAPAAAMVTVPAIVAAVAGSAAVWSFLIATGLALLIGSCIGQFTRRMAAAGSLYSLTAKGLGPGVAFASGVALLVGYGGLVMAAATGAATYLCALLDQVGVPATGPPALAGAVVLVVATAGVLALLGVRLSARVVLLVESVSITLLIVVLGASLGTDGGAAVPVGDPWPGGVLAGVLPALAAFIGFEAATALGVEARRPYRTVPRAVLWTAGVVGLLALFAAVTTTAGTSAAEGQVAPGTLVGPAAGSVPWLAVALDAGITASFFACTLAAGTVLVRVLFSMARDGIVPRRLGATHPRYRTPHVATLTALPVAGVVPVVMLLIGIPGAAVLARILSVATVGFLLGYLLVCLAAPPFLRRIGELTVPPVIATVVIVPILLVVLGAYVASALRGPVPPVLGALLAVGLAWFGWLRLRRPAQLRGIGVYDETAAPDVLDPVLGSSSASLRLPPARPPRRAS